MEEKKYINPDTITHIQNYLSIPSPPGLILAGIDGLGKKNLLIILQLYCYNARTMNLIPIQTSIKPKAMVF